MKYFRQTMFLPAKHLVNNKTVNNNPTYSHQRRTWKLHVSKKIFIFAKNAAVFDVFYFNWVTFVSVH